MIRFLRRDRELDDYIEAVRPELQGIPTPAPTEALKSRIIASRAGGARHILPLGAERRKSTALEVGLAVAAALLILMIPITLRRPGSPANADDIASPGLFGQLAFAQAPRRGEKPSLAPVRVAGSKLRPLALEFERRVKDGAGRTMGTGRISLHVSAASLAGVEAWRIVSVDREPLPTPHVAAETVLVLKSDLRPLRRDIHSSPYSRFQRINVSQRFTGDSVDGRMTTERPSIGAGRTFARHLPPAFAPFMTGSVAPVFLMAAPLGPNWRGSASLLGWAVRDDDVLIPIELRVESEETITVPAGRFDCWRLSLRFSGRQLHYWARKSDGLGVRVLDDTDAKGKGTREIMLTRIQ